MNGEENTEGRDADGRWLRGHAPNPDGKNGERNAGFARWNTRVEALEKKYPTTQSVLDAFEWNKKYDDFVLKEEHQGTNPFDAGILRGMLATIIGGDKRLEREAIWDRREGKPKLTIAGDPDNPLYPQSTKNPTLDEAVAEYIKAVKPK